MKNQEIKQHVQRIADAAAGGDDGATAAAIARYIEAERNESRGEDGEAEISAAARIAEKGADGRIAATLAGLFVVLAESDDDDDDEGLPF